RGCGAGGAAVPGDVGEPVKVESALAPAPFDLRLEQSDDSTVVWRTETFPPHWVGTTVQWDVEPRNDGAAVSFRHAGFGDDDEAGMVAYTWGQGVVRLEEYAESGRPNPVST